MYRTLTTNAGVLCYGAVQRLLCKDAIRTQAMKGRHSSFLDAVTGKRRKDAVTSHILDRSVESNSLYGRRKGHKLGTRSLLVHEYFEDCI